MPRLPHAVHSACHAAHISLWPLHAKVWVPWGRMGWRPGVVVGHRRTRVVVRVDDGLWPFTGGWLGRKSGTTAQAPNSLRVRKTDERPSERAYSPPSCVTLSAIHHIPGCPDAG